MTAPPEARRITGPHLLGDSTGAALDVALGPAEADLVRRWEKTARDLLVQVGWSDEATRVHRFTGGANLFVSAPADSLYAATDLAELAWDVATGGAADTRVAERIDRLRDRIARERNPRLLALAAEAGRRNLTFLHDDHGVSIGSGAGVRLWPEDALPPPGDVPWSAITDVPIALVTGSNGKTTTVRLAAAIARAAGHHVGCTTTDGVVIGDETVAESDFAGPMGARMVLRDARVTFAVLETARGGILRRGLAVRRADAALVTNVGEDHFGDFGINSLAELADVKLVIARAVRDSGYLVLNAADATLRRRAEATRARVIWFAGDARELPVTHHAFTIEGDALVARAGDRSEILARLADIPAAMGGTAVHNVENALAAAALVHRLPDPSGRPIPPGAMRDALHAFAADPASNAGRGNLLDVGGVQVLIDYAHNAAALAAVARVAAAIPARRRLLLIGQAGDRTDDAIRGLMRAGWELAPDLVLIKELADYRRGRATGEVPALMADELARLGVPAARYEVHEDELSAVRRALAWAEPGDLLILLVHQDRARVMALLDAARSAPQRLE